jgi:phosphoglycerate dehydrogenase-like enzyme
MTPRHQICMTGAIARDRLPFYQELTPPEFDLLWIDPATDRATVSGLLRDVEFAYGFLPAGWLDLTRGMMLVQFQGVGYVDSAVIEARQHGVPVAITPEGTCLGVAEHTILLILALYKHLIEAHNALSEGKWIHNRLRYTSYFLYGKVLGIVGLGRIGMDVVQRARGFEPVRIVYYDLFRKSPEEEARLGVEYLELDELLRTADIVSLHVFLSDKSRGMIGERALGLMKSSAILINTSRGAVVDEAALYIALKDRRIWGAGLDAWTEEPTAPDNPITRLDNVVCSPHMATGTVDADRMKFEAAIANYRRVLRGEQPINVVKLYSEIIGG